MAGECGPAWSAGCPRRGASWRYLRINCRAGVEEIYGGTNCLLPPPQPILHHCLPTAGQGDLFYCLVLSLGLPLAGLYN